jgi:Stress responsive A/B Barrel Domain
MVSILAMISHVVLLRLEPDLPAADRRALADAFARAVREIPTVRAVRIGRRVTHGAGYEGGALPFEYLAIVDFEDLAGLQTYLRHPAHAALGDQFGRIFDVSGADARGAAVVFDFEMGDVEGLDPGGIFHS